jgi:alkanesulfonate monooxygenase SsuD/methylene tetrahydromethanopterin reductase-like flavin-dependent oxidoreductase (luciferase family)
MDIGIGLPNAVRGTSGAVFRAWARRAEERGFAGLSTIDRLVYPSHDSLVALSVAAGATDRIGLVSGILLGPLYPPALLAKASATLHAMSGGRLTLGLGVGARQDDFDVAERPFHTRGRDFDAALELMHRAWSGAPVGAASQRICPPLPDGERVPVIFGGNTDAAVQRVVRWGEGWIAAGGGPGAVAPMIDRVQTAWKNSGRAGEPRIGALAYFALGADAVQAGASNLLDYYGFLGEYAERVAEGLLASDQAVREAVGAFQDVGVTELYLVPATASLDQVDQLADVVL